MEVLISKLFPNAQDVVATVLRIFNALELTGYALMVIFLAGTIYCIIMLTDTGNRLEEAFANHFIKHTKTPTKDPRLQRWERVVSAITSPDEQLWRSAIIDANTMLEDAITRMGVEGETLGEKLKTLGNSVPWIDAAWEVNKLRNILAHEGSRYPLNHREAYRAYKIYESILFEVGYLS